MDKNPTFSSSPIPLPTSPASGEEAELALFPSYLGGVRGGMGEEEKL